MLKVQSLNRIKEKITHAKKKRQEEHQLTSQAQGEVWQGFVEVEDHGPFAENVSNIPYWFSATSAFYTGEKGVKANVIKSVKFKW